jgi:hypothetical protein
MLAVSPVSLSSPMVFLRDSNPGRSRLRFLKCWFMRGSVRSASGSDGSMADVEGDDTRSCGGGGGGIEGEERGNEPGTGGKSRSNPDVACPCVSTWSGMVVRIPIEMVCCRPKQQCSRIVSQVISVPRPFEQEERAVLGKCFAYPSTYVCRACRCFRGSYRVCWDDGRLRLYRSYQLYLVTANERTIFYLTRTAIL